MKKTVSLCLIGEKDAQNSTENGGRWCGCVKEEGRMVRVVCVWTWLCSWRESK